KSTEKSTEKILRIIKETPSITILELSQKLQVSTSAIEKNLAKLKSNGLVVRIGSDKGGHWKVK
ncbi:MAG: hypothetical protein RL060_2291, partial [Bacteroidota bacterium]